MVSKTDGHCHYWTLERGDYGWLRPDALHLIPIYRDFGADDMRPLAEAADVDRRILVQAAPTEAETLYLLEQARTDTAVAGVVGWVDLTTSESIESLERFSEAPLFKGVRPMLQDLKDPAWIATRPHPDAIAALKKLGLRFDALVTPPHLDALVTFVHGNPDLPIIIDHAAKPALGAPVDDPRHAMWKRGMAALARAPQVYCKLSGLLTELPADRRGSTEAATTALKPLFDKLLAWFGPERIVWGSDWPVLTLAADYDFWVEVTGLLLEDLSSHERAEILAGSAKRFYDLDGGRAL